MASNYERTHGVTTLAAATLSVDVNAHVGQPIVITKADGATVTLLLQLVLVTSMSSSVA